MIEDRDLFVRASLRFDPPPDAFERFSRRRNRRRRNQRIGTTVVALMVAVAALGTLARALRTTQPVATPTPPVAATFSWGPVSLAFASDGDLFVASCGLDRIYRVDRAGVVSTFANESLEGGLSRDGVPASRARFSCPWGLAFDAAGNLYVADLNNDRVRRVDPSGIVTTIAGSGPTGTGSFAGDGGPATRARLNSPTWIATDPQGNLYIADRDNNALRVINVDGTIRTVAGGPTEAGSISGPGHQGELDGPAGIAIGPDGNIYVADSNRARIRMITPDGKVTTIAGTGRAGYSGDGGPAIEARMANPGGLAFDVAGNLYFADTDNHVIRRIDPSGVIETVAGTGRPGCPEEGEPAVQARLTDPFSVAIDGDGNLYLTDTSCRAVFEVRSDGTIHTFAAAKPTD